MIRSFLNRYRPLARWMVLYQVKEVIKEVPVEKLPSSLELVRFISNPEVLVRLGNNRVFVPSRGG